MIYVCGDIHGNYKGLKQAIEKSDFNPDEDVLVTLGDYIDGGAHIQVLEVLEYLLALPNWVGLIGNHDFWMKETLQSGWIQSDEFSWFRNGGLNTFQTIGVEYDLQPSICLFKNKPPDLVYEFFSKLRFFFEDEANNLYVHAGYRDQNRKLQTSDFTNLDIIYDTIWDRDFWLNALTHNPTFYSEIFIGHSWDILNPQKRGKVYNLDSGAGHDGTLTLMNVETKAYWQSDKTSELYDDYTGRKGEKL